MKKEEDALDFIIAPPAGENYDSLDRYRDFKKLFTSDEGVRVLRQIAIWGHLRKPTISGNPVDHILMAIREGERNMTLKILATINNEPKPQPTKQRQSDG